MKNFYEFWAKRFLRDGIKSIKLVLGLGLAFSLGYSVNLTVGILFFGWVLMESLLDKN